MAWFAAEIEFERELRNRDGQTVKVWLRPATEADILALSDNATDGDLLARQIIRWEIPDPPTVETLARLDIMVSRQLSALVNEINSAEPGPLKEAAPADPLPRSTDAADRSNGKTVELVAS